MSYEITKQPLSFEGLGFKNVDARGENTARLAGLLEGITDLSIKRGVLDVLSRVTPIGAEFDLSALSNSDPEATKWIREREAEAGPERKAQLAIELFSVCSARIAANPHQYDLPGRYGQGLRVAEFVSHSAEEELRFRLVVEKPATEKDDWRLLEIEIPRPLRPFPFQELYPSDDLYRLAHEAHRSGYTPLLAGEQVILYGSPYMVLQNRAL